MVISQTKRVCRSVDVVIEPPSSLLIKVLVHV